METIAGPLSFPHQILPEGTTPFKKEQSDPNCLLTNPAVFAGTGSIDKEVGNNIYCANDQVLLPACS